MYSFKPSNNNFTPKVVAVAYMTGILPIKKDGSQSAISVFLEYPILDPDGFAAFTGFTEGEVKELCERHGMNFEDARNWYEYAPTFYNNEQALQYVIKFA